MKKPRTNIAFGATSLPQRGSDLISVKRHNISLILREIWSHEETSRAALARHTSLSRSTISTLVEGLLAENLIEERGSGISTGGRRPTILSFNDDARTIIGIDMGAAHVSVGVINLAGSIKSWRSQRCPVRDQPLIAVEVLKRLIAEVSREAQIRDGDLLGIGLAVPSPVSRDNAKRLSPLFMPAWSEIDLTRDLGLPSSAPLMIDNDANLGALAECWWGLGQDCDHIAFLKLGTGVGAGFVFDGEIFRGHGGFAGELGHTVIDPSGAPCVCGLRGCLVTYIGAQALLDRSNSRLPSKDQSISNQGYQELSSLLHQLKEGDLIARDVITESAQHLGLAVAGLMNMINPERVILGGDLAAAGDALLHPLRERVNARSPWTSISKSQLLMSQLGDHGIALGAATLVLQAALNHPHQFFKIEGAFK